MTPADFDLQPRTRLVAGAGAARRCGALVRELGLRRVLLVSDTGVAAAGHCQTLRQSLSEAGVEVVPFLDVQENPGAADVERCQAAARAAGIDGFVALGGGSSIDTARAANMVLCNGGSIESYQGHARAEHPLLPLVALPTTAGTGSECQSFALISDAEHRKRACGDPHAAARIAILDPLLTLTQPRAVTIATGLDALVHAVETAVCTRRNPWSLLYSHDSFRRIQACLPRVLATPDDVGARAQMQLGAAFAGLAIEASMLGAAHACANPLTRRFDLVHGHAVALMLPAVVRFNAADPAACEAYATLARRAGLAAAAAPAQDGCRALQRRIDALLELVQIPPLRATGMGRTAIAELAQEAATQWTGRFNPRPVSEQDFAQLYAASLDQP